MADILKSVSSAFANTSDARIDYHVVEKGSASLITGVYDQTDPFTQGFYRKPDITGTGDTTKLALIYGQAMITPFLVDAGVSSSTNDPSSILTTYRFITGDGTNSGIPNGPNGSPLENIYIKDPNGIPQPVVNDSGQPSLGNVILASALGAAISSAPKLWNALTSSSTAKTGTVDPITGKPILSAEAQKAAATAAQISIGQLSDVSDAGKGQDYVLTYDATQLKWVPKSFNELTGGVFGSSTICGGAGGTGGSGGAGGSGGTGGTGGSGGAGSSPPVTVDPCYPTVSFVNYPCVTASTTTLGSMVLLPTLANTASNEYTQSIPVVGTKGVELHFNAQGNGKKAVWKMAAGSANSCDVTSDFACFTDPNKTTVESPGGTTEIDYLDPSEFDIQICLTANICGSEYLIYKTTLVEAALSKAPYTFSTTINWADTKIANLLVKYPGQVFNATTPNVKLYLSRTDTCGSEFGLYFEGYKRILGDTYFSPVRVPQTSSSTTPKPTPIIVKADDGKQPDTPPSGGGMSAPSCPVEVVIPGTLPTTGSPGAAGGSGSAGTSGVAGTAGSCTTINTTPVPQPSISLSNPCTKQYGTQTVAGIYDAVAMPALTLSSGIASTTVTVEYSIETGSGTFSLSGAIPGTVSSAITISTLTFTGPTADIQTASALVRFVPDAVNKDEIAYTVIITNADGTNAGTGCTIVPITLVTNTNQAASAQLVISSSSTGGTALVHLTFNGKTVNLTSGAVAYTTSPTVTAANIASNINANVAFQTALDPTDPAWLPNVKATSNAGTITVTAPAAGGSDFNGMTLTADLTSGFVLGTSNTTFLGGITKSINDFLANNIPNWDKVSDVLLGIAGNVLGAVAANMIMNNASQLQISIPATVNPTDVAFLYRGRIVAVPNEYDAVNRSGHPASYAAFSGVWKQSWTQNPIWCLYDFITNKKYGLGNDIILTTAQNTALMNDIFTIGAYCDTITTTSSGVNQPLFSLNTVITDGTKLQILQQLCSVFYGAYIFNNGGLRITCDKQSTNIKLLVNQANAGEFTKALTSSKNFVNKVRLSYVEPSNFYTEEIIVAENSVAISKWGEKVSDVISFGCTDVDQATRYATWILNSEIQNSINVSYTGGLDHYNLVPGDLVEFYDSNERGKRRSGRIVSQSGTTVVVDSPIVSVAGDYFSLMLSDGTVHQTTIASKSGTTITLTAAPSVAADPYATFIAAASAQGRKLYKVIKINETSNSKFAINLQYYNPNKFVSLATSTVPSVPTNTRVSRRNSSQIYLEWDASTQTSGPGVAGYKVYANHNYTTPVATVTTNKATISGLSTATNYDLQIAAYSLDSTPITSVPSTDFYTFTRANYYSISAFGGGSIAYSFDSLATLTAGGTTIVDNWFAIAAGKNVAVTFAASSNIMAYKIIAGTGGTVWISQTLAHTTTSAGWVYTYSALASGGAGQWVAISQNETYALYSADGVTWTPSTMPVAATWQTPTFINGIWLTIGSGSSIAATSTDGITWTQRAMPATAVWNAPSAGYDRFVVMSNSSSNVALMTQDGINWTQATMPSTQSWRFPTFFGGKWVSMSNASTAGAYSYDGITWSTITLPVSNLNRPSYGNGIWVALSNTSGTAYATSTDGISWTSRTLPVSGLWRNTSFGDGVFMTVINGSDNKFMKSTDGISWTSMTLPSTANWQSPNYA
jgi:hypothetical protein